MGGDKCRSVRRRRGSDYTGDSVSTIGTPAGGVKRNVFAGTGAFGSSPVKVKWVMAPSVSSIWIAEDGSFGGDGEGEKANALLLSVRNAGECEMAVGRGGEGEMVQLLFELGMAEKKTQR